MIKRTFKKDGSKNGIALIVTLGFLAVLILMAVAFSVSMRVERQAAKNFADVIQARQWTYSALAYAMSETEKHIGTAVMLPDANHVYPSSGGGDVVANPTLYSGSATNYVPGSLQFAAANTTVNWTPVKDDTPAQKVVAQYAYEVIDCSGLIDANMGSLVNQTLPGSRGVATNAFDLWLDNAILPELAVGAESDLKRGYDKPLKYAPDPKRVAPWYEFSSFADFWQTLRTGPYCAGVLAPGFFPQNFFIYSRFPKGYLNSAGNAVNQPLTLENSQASWDTPGGLRGLLVTEITNMGGVNEPDALACQIIDYCDGDHRPTGPLTTFDTETTPLLNEFSIEVRVESGTGTNILVRVQPRVEVWYPFINSTNTLSYTLKFQLVFPGSLSVYNMNIGIGAVPNASLSPAGGKWIYNTYYAPPPGAASPAGFPEVVVTNGPLGFAGQKVLVSAAVIEGTQNQQVDSIPVRFPLKLDDVKTTVGSKTVIGMACDDPRFNAYASDWTYTLEGASPAPTISGFNKDVAYSKGGGDFPAGSTNLWIYMPDQKLRSSGELGLIACDPTKPWTTIDLLSGPGFLPILDRFTILTNKLRRGLVNINSWNSNVLATAFNQAPGERYPGESAASTCTVAMAKALGATLSSKAPYKNVSEISGMGLITGFDRMQTEGVIRNTADILSVRQNVFTILVAAQTGSDINGNQKLDPDEVSGEQHAIAVVWRDPYPNAQGTHESFVRYFRWLTD